MLQTFEIASEFIDPEAERALIAAVAQDHGSYWQTLDLLPAEAFATEGPTWRQVVQAIEQEQHIKTPESWKPADDPQATAHRLAELLQKRLLAGLQEKLGAELYADRPVTQILSLLEDQMVSINQAIREFQSGRLLWGSDLVGAILDQAAERVKLLKETGKTITGLSTGLVVLDECLNGLNPGLTVLAGAPGAGKTTFALQLALQAAKDGIPALYVTYENSPSNLILKVLCAQAGLSPASVEKGRVDPVALSRAASDMSDVLKRLAVIEGTFKLTVAQVRGKALQAMARYKAQRCLVIFDYLQRASHAHGYDQIRSNISALAGELRDLANRLSSPVIAISSQNRAAGNYGNGGGSAALDSLKESGDLEYSADVVLFLCRSDRREVTPPARPVDLVIAKNRHGAADTVVPLIFRPDIGALREVNRP